MPCLTQTNITPQKRAAQRTALERLIAAVGAGSVSVVVGRSGSVAFKGWSDAAREGVSDLCAYRAIANAPEIRRALFRAEALSGNKLDPRAMASGLHSHDGGSTWSRD